MNFDWIEPARTLRIRVDQDQARLLGVSSEALAQALNSTDLRRQRDASCATAST